MTSSGAYQQAFGYAAHAPCLAPAGLVPLEVDCRTVMWALLKLSQPSSWFCLPNQHYVSYVLAHFPLILTATSPTSTVFSDPFSFFFKK